MQAKAKELSNRLRDIDVPVNESGKPDRRYTERIGDAIRVYEYEGDNADGLRVYRHVSTERA